MTVDPAVLQVARQALTAKQYAAWELESQGYSIEAMMFRLDLHKSSIRDRLSAAHLNLIRAGVRMTPNGSYYLEESA